MTESQREASYVFEDVASARELARLRAIEAIFDTKTRDLLRATGELAGRRLLEVGAGAGSVARFLRAEAGPSGRVVAVDTNPRFLLDLAGVEVVTDDVRKLAPGAYESDVVHARYALIHNENPESVLDAMLDQLAPGGFVLLEEPDFSAARALAGPEEFLGAHAAVSQAIAAMFRERGMDPAFGLRLEKLLRARGIELVRAECEVHEAVGGSPMARMMRLSTEQLAEKYFATGAVSRERIVAHLRYADDASCSAIHYATQRALGKKPARSER